jgi:hypothetical protein
MIGRALPGHARPWQIAAALTAVRQAFAADKMYVSRSTLGGDVLSIVISSGPIEDPREFLTWRPRGLRIAFPVLAACPDEAAVARLVEGAVSKIARGAVVELGLVATVPAQPSERLGRPINRSRRRVLHEPEDRPAGYPRFGEWARDVKPAEVEEPQPVETSSEVEQDLIRQPGPRLGRRVPAEELKRLLSKRLLRKR